MGKPFKPLHVSKFQIMKLCPERILEIMKVLEYLYSLNKCNKEEAANRGITNDEWNKAFAIPRTRWLAVNDYVSTLYIKKLMKKR